MGELTGEWAKRAGREPGSVQLRGGIEPQPARAKVFTYTADDLVEAEADRPDQCAVSERADCVTWIDVVGVRDPDFLDDLGRRLDIHPLTLEDIVHTDQRPKLEDYGHYLFVVLKVFPPGQPAGESDQLSLLVGKNYLVSFSERDGGMFDALRDRLRRGHTRLRRLGPDYLAYALIDAVVDSYFTFLERIGEEIQELEDAVVDDPRPDNLRRLHVLRREAVVLRRALWPLRGAVDALERSESDLINASTAPFLKDVRDHVNNIIETMEVFREMISNLLELYLTGLSNRLNEAMKVLTIIATLFMPLAFIAGVYGMNFKFMPELEWRWGYPAALTLMAVVAGVMLRHFRRKKWI